MSRTFTESEWHGHRVLRSEGYASLACGSWFAAFQMSAPEGVEVRVEPCSVMALPWFRWDWRSLTTAQPQIAQLTELLLALRAYRSGLYEPELLLVHGAKWYSDLRSCIEWIEQEWIQRVGCEFQDHPKSGIRLPHVELRKSRIDYAGWDGMFDLSVSKEAVDCGAFGFTNEIWPMLGYIESWLDTLPPVEVWLTLGPKTVQAVQHSLQQAAIWLKWASR